MSRPPAPAFGVRPVLRLAVRPLPRRTDRDRYYSEFVADVHGLPARAQLRFAAGALTQSLALRSALGDPRPGTEEVPMSSFGRRFCCRVLRVHHWQPRSSEDGGRYLACSVCGRERVGGPAHIIGA